MERAGLECSGVKIRIEGVNIEIRIRGELHCRGLMCGVYADETAQENVWGRSWGPG